MRNSVEESYSLNRVNRLRHYKKAARVTPCEVLFIVSLFRVFLVKGNHRTC